VVLASSTPHRGLPSGLTMKLQGVRQPRENVMGFISVLIVLAIVYAFASIRILKQYERGVVFFLGSSPGCAAPA